MSSLTIIDSKIPKKLEDINQEAKHLFPYYFIDKGRVISFDNNRWNPTSEIHYMELCDKLSIPSLHDLTNTEEFATQLIVFSSIDLYNTLKNTKKKDIRTFDITDNLYLTTATDSIQIGLTLSKQFVYNQLSNKLCNLINFKERWVNEFYAKFDQKTVDDLMATCITLDCAGYRMRISKRLFPNMKKTDIIGVHIKDGEDGYFNAIFEITKESGLKIYHSYNFINF